MPAEVSALVPAAGSGTRLGLGPKSELLWGNKTLARAVSEKLKQVASEVLVGLRPDRLERGRADLEGIAQVHAGGETRFQTLKRLLSHARFPLVLICDANRPFASLPLIRRVLEAAEKSGASGAFFDPVVPAALLSPAGKVESALPRGKYLLPQSPHAYRKELLVRAFEAAERDGLETQTTFELVARLGVPIEAVPGEETNFKITTPKDWEMAHLLMEKNSPG